VHSVIIVDDNPLIRMGLPSLISWEALDAKVIGSARDGDEAIGLCRSKSPDIVVTDIRMPGKDGLYLLDFLQREFPNVSTIVISAYDEFKYAKRALEAGSTNYLLKPINPKELEKALAKAIRRCESQHSASTEKDALAVFDMMGGIEGGKACYLLLSRGELSESRFGGLPGFESARRIVLEESPESCLVLVFDAGSDPGADQLCRIACPASGACEVSDACVAEKVPHGLAAQGMQSAFLDAIEKLHLQAFWFGQERAPRLEDGLSAEARMRLYLAACKADALLGSLRERLEPCARSDCASQKLNKAAVVAFLKLLIAASKRHFDLIRDLLERVEAQERTGSFACGAAVLDEVSRILATICDDEVVETDGTRKLAIQLKRVIDENYMRDLSLASLAGLFCYSTAYVSRAFKREYGYGVTKYMTDVRMRKAADLLMYTDKKVAQIAEDVGFSDHIYFSKQFKKWSGTTPGAFRAEGKK
jgi:two-component system response regulator YesN